MIVDSGSSKNVPSEKLVKAMGLSTQQLPKPYKVGWIKKKPETRVIEIYKVPLSIGKIYQDVVSSDVMDMDAYHVL